jgi:acetylornithine deacetylase/succinyl-diaminopimelate desuccinylase-like protein
LIPLLALCKRLIATPSVTTEGTRRVAQFCADEVLAPAGISARLIASPNEGPEQVNLLALIRGRNREATPLLLNTHLDTVAPGAPELWTECGGNPFAPAVKGDGIYGLGAADTKCDFAAKLSALIQSPAPARDVWLVATFGEEHGLVGAKELAAAGIIPRGAATFVGEPSHLELITAHKGLLVFELALRFIPARAERSFRAERATFAGKAAHSSTPALGENAIVRALAAVAALPRMRVAAVEGGDAVNKVPARCEVVAEAGFAQAASARTEAQAGERAEFIPPRVLAALARFVNLLTEYADRSAGDEPDFAPPALTCNPGLLSTGADALVLEFELRPPPALALDAVRRGVAQLVEQLESVAPGVELALTEKRANPGFRTAEASATVELAMGAMARAGIPLSTGVKAGCTEAGIYAAAGLSPAVFGPGPSTGVIHAPNEYNLLSEVEAAVRFYRALLE